MVSAESLRTRKIMMILTERDPRGFADRLFEVDRRQSWIKLHWQLLCPMFYGD